jgi:hypothetical protein
VSPAVSPLHATSTEGTRVTATWAGGEWVVERRRSASSGPNPLTAHMASTVYGAELRSLEDGHGLVKWVLLLGGVIVYSTGHLVDWTPDG